MATIVPELEVADALHGNIEVAASLGDIDKLYKAIDNDPAILEDVDAKSFVNTPLHIAAYKGHVNFAIEIMRLKPSFALKLNKQGYSPIHVALDNNHQNLVRRLVDVNKDLVRVKGREGNTPLHYVCQSDSQQNIELLVDLIKACPDSINDVNMRNETPLHISLKNGCLKAFQVMVNWLNINTRKGAKLLEESTLNRKDEDGNTILHISALNRNEKAVELLKGCTWMYKNEKNVEGKTALDLADAFPEIKKLLKKARAKRGESIPHLSHEIIVAKPNTFRGKVWRGILRGRRELSADQRSAYMVVISLIITAIYHTALSPPGGLYPAERGTNNLNTTASSASLNSTTNLMPKK